MRSRSLIAPVVVSIGFALVLSSCAPGAPMPTPTPTPTFAVTGDGVLTIGSLFPTSGTFSFIGAGQVAGVEAAVREINEAGGVNAQPVVVLHRNSGDTSTETAEASFADLLTKNTDVVIGPSSSALAARLVTPAVAAGVPLISPAATLASLTALDDSGLVFRTIGSYQDQGGALAQAIAGADLNSVAYLYVKGVDGEALLSKLTTAAEIEGLTLDYEKSFLATTTNFAGIVTQITKAEPDAIIISSPADASTATKALITALSAAKLGGAKLWLTSQNLADYSQALPAAMLDKANGVLEGATPDAAFIAKLKQADPSLTSYRYAQEAYDATIMAALAATIAGDDGGPAVARLLPSISIGGIKCTSYGECLDVLTTESDIDYDGISGPLNLTPDGDVTSASWGVYVYGAGNTYSFVRTIVY